ncbi:glutathione S-transferase N-terminal domain-containing protein [Phenylobacterium sp.]|uniref:glutathione S-transferase family protein n=1 Tax=Phenylobacterium sp. TaxID=1871053 RepID=UPI00286E816E|nr:glutathione S-transferase N-terminal domain-containing protein [Phenylobacterium sp.]
MYELHYSPGTASLLPHMMLRELGVPFTLKLVDREAGEQAGADYLKLNPHGRIPVLVENGRALYETAAIALFLADRHSGLAPRLGAVDRADYYKWMVHLANTTQAEFRSWFYPHEYIDDPAHEASAKAAAGKRMMANFEVIAGQLEGRDWLLPSGFSAADLYLLMMVRWGRTLPRPARDLPVLGAHAQRVLDRTAVQATFAAEGLAAPLV